jgi:hypothetical protein
VSEEGSYSVFLVGDGGKPETAKKDEVLALLETRLLKAGSESAVIFLGDNIYPRGLPAIGDPLRSMSELRINVQLDVLKDYKGKPYFISGNHDWNKGRSSGFSYVKRQEAYIEEYLGRGDVYLPSDGCPGPVEINIGEHLRFIFINTQWFLQKGYKPAGKDCKAESAAHFFALLDEMLGASDRTTIVAGHHPIYSRAVHGGYYNLRHHLFPLRVIHKKLYIPLPFIGTLYPLYRKLLGTPDDMAYPPYQQLRKNLVSIFRKHKDLIYASGHDHNLQYMRKKGQHYLISGSASSAAYVSKGGVFTFRKKGFLELIVQPGNKVKVIAWASHPGIEEGIKLAEEVIRG